jgi:hypothetical protein
MAAQWQIERSFFINRGAQTFKSGPLSFKQMKYTENPFSESMRYEDCFVTLATEHNDKYRDYLFVRMLIID